MPYDNYLEQEGLDLHMHSFDGGSPKFRKNYRSDSIRENNSINMSFPNNLELDKHTNSKIKDYASISTTMTTVNKKVLGSKNKFHSVLDIKYSSSSNHSVMSPDSFGILPHDYFGGATPMSNSKFSIKLNKNTKSKEQLPKETIAR